MIWNLVGGRQKGLTASHLHAHLDPSASNDMKLWSVGSQKGLTSSHLHAYLDPSASNDMKLGRLGGKEV